MGLFDMFTKPKWEHKDWQVRRDAVKNLDNQEILVKIAKNELRIFPSKTFALNDYLPKGEKIIPGKTIVPLKGVTSIAVTEEGANYYVEKAGKTLEEMKWLFEIEMPTGTRGTYVSHVTIDKYKPEMEFLTKKDTYVKILEFDEEKHYAKLRIINQWD